MKVKLFAIALLAITTLTTSACAPKGEVALTCDDFGKTAHITRQAEITSGKTLKVTLCSNATTGFRWVENVASSDASVLQQTGHRFSESAGKEAVGAAGTQEWTFKALKTGETTLSFEYSRPWEGGEKKAWTLTLTVIVK